ncbi:MAG: inositol monophosphatase [Candidatus Omnitrophota bacterium]
MSDIITTAVAAAQQAGVYLLHNFGKIKEVISKGDRNLVTNVDRQAQAMIIDAIKKKFPEHGIIAEEGLTRDVEAEYVWIIDPLDGTHNYIRGIPVFGVSIGVVRQGKFTGGVIYMPFDDELYVAETGNGAYKNGVLIKVSTYRDLKECSASYDSGIRYNPKALLPILGEIADTSFNVRMFGSSARSLSYLAEGKIDISIEFEDQPWDCAAGICLIEQAGGRVTDLSGNPMAHTTIGYIATNGNAHEAVLDIVRKYR